MSPAALLPFRPPYDRYILAGLKTVEIRRRPLDKWHTIYIYRADGGSKLIVGRFDLGAEGADTMTAATPDADFLARACLTSESWRIFTDGAPFVYAHKVVNPHTFAQPIKWWWSAPQGPWGLTLEQVLAIEEQAGWSQPALTDSDASVSLLKFNPDEVGEPG